MEVIALLDQENLVVVHQQEKMIRILKMMELMMRMMKIPLFLQIVMLIKSKI
jgi:hypothetical protein